MLFSRWPKQFNTFLTHLYQTVHIPGHTPSDIQYRWRWLLANKDVGQGHFLWQQWKPKTIYLTKI
jgi:hypothetical protein